MRDNAKSTDLSDILPEEVEEKVKEAAEISMGTEISDEDILNIKHLCQQVVEIQEYRSQLYEYLKNRMMAIAPNLTILVGELVSTTTIVNCKHPQIFSILSKHCLSYEIVKKYLGIPEEFQKYQAFHSHWLSPEEFYQILKQYLYLLHVLTKSRRWHNILSQQPSEEASFLTERNKMLYV